MATSYLHPEKLYVGQWLLVSVNVFDTEVFLLCEILSLPRNGRAEISLLGDIQRTCHYVNEDSLWEKHSR